MSKHNLKSLGNILFPATLILAACGTTDLVDTNQANTSTQNSTSATIQNVATCKMSQTSAGINVVCDGKVVGTLTNGTDGSSGKDGKDGVGCSMTELDGGIGYSVKCGETTGVILNGANGKDGVNGTSCETSKIPDGSGIYVICGETAVAVLNGKDGSNGKDGLDGKDGTDGLDGQSCTATESEEGFDLYCGDELVGTIKNGADGKDGSDGIDGKDGLDGSVVGSCRIGSATDTTMTIICGEDTNTIKAVVNVKNIYNNGSLAGTTFDPIIVQVSSSSAKSSSSATVDILSSSSIEYTVEAGVVTGNCESLSAWWIGVNKGDSTQFKFNYNEVDANTILNSVFEWHFGEGMSLETYTAKGTDGLITPKVQVTEWDYFYENDGYGYSHNVTLYVNGEQTTSCSIRLYPSKITGCSCEEDKSYTGTDRKWKLSGCKTFVPITSYTWSGVETTSTDGTIGYSPATSEDMVFVNVKNEDNVIQNVYCGGGRVLTYRDSTVIYGFADSYYDEDLGKYIETITYDTTIMKLPNSYTLEEGIHQLQYDCIEPYRNNWSDNFHDDDYQANYIDISVKEGTSATLLTSKRSEVITSEMSTLYPSDMFGSDNIDDVRMKSFTIDVKSGSVTLKCRDTNGH